MAKAIAAKLARLVEAVRTLPTDSQSTIVRELVERVAELSASQMSDEQRAEVKRRKSSPHRVVPDARVRAILRRYNPDL